MHESCFQNENWYLALGLSERARCIAPDEEIAASEIARRRLERWRAQRPFTHGDWLERRLDADGLDVPALERTLALPASELKRRAPRPDWLAHIESAFDSRPSGREFTPGAVLAESDPAAGFLHVIGPMLEAARSRLRAALAPLDGRPPLDAERVVDEFMSAISARALHAIERALVLELHIAKVEGRLAGADPQARFGDFVRLVSARGEAESVLAMYPVMSRRVAESIDHGVAAATEFVERLVDDWPEIRRVLFAGRDPGALRELEAQAGDPHKRGRSVVIATFESGERLVYKPRPLDADLHFQQLLEFVNARLEEPGFRTLALVTRPHYGWMEFVAAEPCRSHADARRYYRRVGGLLAVLHTLRGVDCHFENIVAHGDQPVLVDLETILHPAIPHQESNRFDRRFSGRVLTQSVLRVGLLPVPFGGDDPAKAVDLSGVASVEGAMSPDRVLQWENRGTDEMHVVRAHVEMGGAENRAFLDGRPLQAVDFRGDIVAGFDALYRLLAREKNALLARDGPVRRFAGDTVRVVIRATRAYGMLLSESLHPDLLRDALDRDRFFDRLWVGVDEHPALARVVGAEHHDLVHGDIPYFTTRPGERHLWTSTGARIDDFFAQPSLHLVEARLRGMDEADLARQRWIVTLSLGSLAASSDAPEAPPARARGATIHDATGLHRRCIDEAARIGDHLGEIAAREDDCAAWVTLEFREQRWLLEPVSNDLYVGLPGVALFLAHLARVERRHGLSGADAHEELARAAVRTILRTMGDADVTAVGAFSGWGGILYGLTHAAALWNDDEVRRACDFAVRRIDDFAARDEDADLVGGLAGAVAALCAAHETRVPGHALAVAVRAGEMLLARAHRTHAGLWWTTRLAGDTPATGFSHGNAGIGWALCRLGRVGRAKTFGDAGLAAIAFERQRMREQQHAAGHGEVPRHDAHEHGLLATWCYGAPGIGISRLDARYAATDARVRNTLADEARQAVMTTLENGFGHSHCLCHGDLGSIDFLLRVHGAMPDVVDHEGARIIDRIHGETASTLQSIEQRGWLCGTPAHVPSPGLMNGWAGVGYGLLRVAHPEDVPSVLALESPAGKEF